MSFSSSLVERAKGWPYRLLPVFHNRQFYYTTIVIRRSSGIRVGYPEDLKGKRFAVGDYQQSAALWIRGVLQHEYGVTPQDMEWVQTRGEHYSHTGASGTRPPVRLSYATKPASQLFLDGDIDAAMSWLGIGEENALERRGQDIRGNPDFTLLFDDPRAEGIRYYRKTGIYPPQHTTAIRESILREHPWVAVSLVNAFEEAKRLAIARMRNQTLFVFTNQYIEELRALFGADPFVYGVKPNRAAIDFVQTISVEQGLTPKKQPLEEIFPEEVLIAEERIE
jgi:4,5-dihydroxyphthalate decarboxylase